MNLPQARLPGTLYHVLVAPGGRPLKFREKGGGTYRLRKEAERQHQRLIGGGVNRSSTAQTLTGRRPSEWQRDK